MYISRIGTCVFGSLSRDVKGYPMDVYYKHDFKDVVLIPIGSFERHGYHLPLTTDCITARFFSKLIAEKYGYLLMPAICYSPVSGKYPNTGVRKETFERYLRDILEDLRRNGVKKVIIVLGHGGPEIKEAIGNALRSSGLEFIAFHILSELENLGIVDQSVDRHAGKWETSLIMFIDEDLVREIRESEEIVGNPREANKEFGAFLVEKLLERFEQVKDKKRYISWAEIW